MPNTNTNNRIDREDEAEDIDYYRKTQKNADTSSTWTKRIAAVITVISIAIGSFVLEVIRDHQQEGSPPNLFGMQDVPFHYTENPLIAQSEASIRRYMTGRCSAPTVNIKMDDTHYHVDCLVGNETQRFVIESYEEKHRWYLRHTIEQ